MESAPRAEPATSTPSSTKLRLSHSCERCAMRKVKCDALQPVCGACTKHNAECKYRILPPRQRRKKPDRSQVLLGRSKQYERPLEQREVLNLQQDLAAASLEHPSPNSRLLLSEKRSKLFENLWSRVVDELAEPADALDYSSSEENEEEDKDESMTYLLGQTPSSTSMEDLHPEARQVLELWAVFRANVDPLTKIVHAPTLDKAVTRASSSLTTIPRGLECLLFAMYSVAILSLKDDECRQRFGESRGTLLSRYRAATKATLSRARFVGSSNLAVLQAFVLHLYSIRDVSDSRTVWTLVGLALRMAEGMGLHRDGTSLGLRPFDTEVRRRIWWQLKMLEGRSSELSGGDKHRSIDIDPRAPQMPANIDDIELFPDMTSIPDSSHQNRATDMAFCSVRFEVRNLTTQSMAKHGKDAMLWDNAPSTDPSASPGDLTTKEKIIKEIEQVMQEKYLRFFDPTIPLQLLATIVVQGGFSLMNLMAHHPRRWDERVSDDERNFVWKLTVRTVQQWVWIHHSRDLQGFVWHLGFYFHWGAFIHILDTLRIDPLREDASTVWQLVDDVFEIAPKFITNTKKALHIAIGSLCLKAYTARESALAKAGQPTPFMPWYIEKLREQRASLANRARPKGSDSTKSVSGNIGVTATTIAPLEPVLDSLLPQNRAGVGRPPDAAGTQQSAPGFPPDAGATVFNVQAPSDDLFMFADSDVPAIDFEALFDADIEMGNSVDQSIDWVKWDSLMTDFT